MNAVFPNPRLRRHCLMCCLGECLLCTTVVEVIWLLQLFSLLRNYITLYFNFCAFRGAMVTVLFLVALLI